MKKRQIVLSDKAKIEHVIRELDEKKNEALKKAHKQVNKVRIFFSFFPLEIFQGNNCLFFYPDVKCNSNNDIFSAASVLK